MEKINYNDRLMKSFLGENETTEIKENPPIIPTKKNIVPKEVKETKKEIPTVLRKQKVKLADGTIVTMELNIPKNIVGKQGEMELFKKEANNRNEKILYGRTDGGDIAGGDDGEDSWANIFKPTQLFNVVPESSRPLEVYRKQFEKAYPVTSFLTQMGVPVVGAHYGAKALRGLGSIFGLASRRYTPNYFPGRPLLSSFARFRGVGALGLISGLGIEVAAQNSGFSEESDLAYLGEFIGPSVWKIGQMTYRGIKKGIGTGPVLTQASERLANLKLTERLDIYRKAASEITRKQLARFKMFGPGKGGSPSQILYDRLDRSLNVRFVPREQKFTQVLEVLKEMDKDLPEEILDKVTTGKATGALLYDLLNIITDPSNTSRRLGDVYAVTTNLASHLRHLGNHVKEKGDYFQRGYASKILNAMNNDMKNLTLRNSRGQILSRKENASIYNLWNEARTEWKKEQAFLETKNFFDNFSKYARGGEDFLSKTKYTKKQLLSMTPSELEAIGVKSIPQRFGRVKFVQDVDMKKLKQMSDDQLKELGFIRDPKMKGTNKIRRIFEEEKWSIEDMYTAFKRATNPLSGKGVYNQYMTEGLGKDNVKNILEVMKNANRLLQREGSTGSSLMQRQLMANYFGRFFTGMIGILTFGLVTGKEKIEDYTGDATATGIAGVSGGGVGYIIGRMMGLRQPERVARWLSNPTGREIIAYIMVNPPRSVVDAYNRGVAIGGRLTAGAIRTWNQGLPVDEASAQAKKETKESVELIRDPTNFGRILTVEPTDWGVEYETAGRQDTRFLEGISLRGEIPIRKEGDSLKLSSIPTREQVLNSEHFNQTFTPQQKEKIIDFMEKDDKEWSQMLKQRIKRISKIREETKGKRALQRLSPTKATSPFTYFGN